MCLAIPLRLKSVNGTDAVGEVGGIERDISVLMTPGVRAGDYVIVHAGFAIQVLDQQEAEENLAILREMAGAVEEQRRTHHASRTTHDAMRPTPEPGAPSAEPPASGPQRKASSVRRKA